MLQERGRSPKNHARIAQPSLFDQDQIPTGPKLPEGAEPFPVSFLVNVAFSTQEVTDVLAEHHDPRVLLIDTQFGEYKESRPGNSSGRHSIQTLPAQNLEELKARHGGGFAGTIMLTEDSHIHDMGVLPFIGGWTDRIGPLTADRAFFLALIRVADPDSFSHKMTKSMKDHLQVTVPNHNSRYNKGKIIDVRGVGTSFIPFFSSRDLSQGSQETVEDFPWGVPQPRQKIVPDSWATDPITGERLPLYNQPPSPGSLSRGTSVNLGLKSKEQKSIPYSTQQKLLAQVFNLPEEPDITWVIRKLHQVTRDGKRGMLYSVVAHHLIGGEKAYTVRERFLPIDEVPF